MFVEAIIDNPVVHQSSVGDVVGRCEGVVLRIERNLAVVIKTEPTREKCYYCTLQRYCDQSMAKED